LVNIRLLCKVNLTVVLGRELPRLEVGRLPGIVHGGNPLSLGLGCNLMPKTLAWLVNYLIAKVKLRLSFHLMPRVIFTV